MAFATVEIVDVIENVCSGAAQENPAYQGQDFEDFRVPGSGLGFGGADAMLRHFVRAGIRYSRHSTSPEGYLPRVGLNGGHSYASYSRSPKRLGEKGKGKGGEASIRQHRLASEVKSIVSSALQQGPYDSALLQRCGFEIEEVKMSGDLRKAFVLWKAMPGMHQTVEKELNAQGKRLRSLVFEQLSMPFSPAIQFRQDKVNPQAQAIDDVLSKLDEESD